MMTHPVCTKRFTTMQRQSYQREATGYAPAFARVCGGLGGVGCEQTVQATQQDAGIGACQRPFTCPRSVRRAARTQKTRHALTDQPFGSRFNTRIQ